MKALLFFSLSIALESTNAQPGGGGGGGGIDNDNNSGDCVSDIPVDGTTGAVQLAFYANTGGGSEGDDCPVSCDDGSIIKEQWYAVEDDTANPSCYQWPGNSGENSMISGTCHVDTNDQSFTYDQFTTCTCEGNANSKTVHTDRCVVDTPPTLCSKIIDYSGCENDQAGGGGGSGIINDDNSDDSGVSSGVVFFTTYFDDECTNAASDPIQMTVDSACNLAPDVSMSNLQCFEDRISWTNWPNTGTGAGYTEDTGCVDATGQNFPDGIPNELVVGVCTEFPGPNTVWKKVDADTYDCFVDGGMGTDIPSCPLGASTIPMAFLTAAGLVIDVDDACI